jgi:hypothetical protein
MYFKAAGMRQFHMTLERIGIIDTCSAIAVQLAFGPIVRIPQNGLVSI